MKIFANNKMSLTLIRDLKSQNYIKYIDVIYYHIRTLVEDGEILIKQILSSDMLANGLTKALSTGLFKRDQICQ